MSEEASQQNQDIVAGKLVRGKKQSGEDAAYFSLMIFEIDPKTMQPKVIGNVKINGKEYPKHRIIRSFRVAESSLLKVANGEQSSCNIYWKIRR